MRFAVALALVSVAVMACGLAGCTPPEKKTAGAPPVQLGTAAGEKPAGTTETAPPPVMDATAVAVPTVTDVATPTMKTGGKTSKTAAKGKPEVTPKPATYVVQKGDTLMGIARKFYGDPAKWKDIQKANAAKIPEASALKAGMEIKLP